MPKFSLFAFLKYLFFQLVFIAYDSTLDILSFGRFSGITSIFLHIGF